MDERIRVVVYATDPVTEAGLAAQLRSRQEVELVDVACIDEASVALVSAERVDDAAVRVLRAVRRNGCPRVVLVVSQLEEPDVFTAIEAGAVGLLRRATANADEIVGALRAAHHGGGSVPPDLLGAVLRQVHDVQHDVLGPRGLAFSGLSPREVDVLRLVADGLDTKEIARDLCYSERTIKHIIQEVTGRYQLRNRSHAVAYALRQGLI